MRGTKTDIIVASVITQSFPELISIGIESTAHTFGIGITDSQGKILADCRRTIKPEKGGIHPRDTSRHHYDVAPDVLKEALGQSGLNLDQVDIVAFSRGPGLGPCLRVGATMARAIAVAHSKPLIGVNHCLAHLEIALKLTGAKDPVFLYLSGGNTQVISEAEGRYVVFGETEDIAIGNLLDVFARSAGLSFPGGPKLEELAMNEGKLIDLPYVVKGMNVSFSGLLTMVQSLMQKERLEDLAYSIQEVCFSMLLEASERAMAYLGKNELTLAGGVGANKRLREMAGKMCEERGAKFFDYAKEYYVDNGVMISWAGLEHFSSGDVLPIESSKALQKWRIEDVKIPRRL